MPERTLIKFMREHGSIVPQGHSYPVPPGSVTSEDGEEGPMGMPGIQGAIGATGATGPAGSAIAEGRPKLADGTLTAYMLPGVTLLNGTANTFTLTVNQLNYTPILVVSSIILDAIIMNVTTLQAGSLARMGIYNADTDWQPTTLVVGSGIIDTGSVGVKTVTTSTTLAAGRYLLAVNSDTTGAIVRAYEGYMPSMGVNSALGANAQFQMFRVTQTFAAFPATGDKWTSVVQGATGIINHMFLRVLTP